jgi:hypothetical protein
MRNRSGRAHRNDIVGVYCQLASHTLLHCVGKMQKEIDALRNRENEMLSKTVVRFIFHAILPFLFHDKVIIQGSLLRVYFRRPAQHTSGVNIYIETWSQIQISGLPKNRTSSILESYEEVERMILCSGSASVLYYQLHVGVIFKHVQFGREWRNWESSLSS